MTLQTTLGGGVIRSPGAPPVTIRDYWTASTRLSPIVVKEALALVNVLSAGEHLISNARVDAYTDNTTQATLGSAAITTLC